MTPKEKREAAKRLRATFPHWREERCRDLRAAAEALDREADREERERPKFTLAGLAQWIHPDGGDWITPENNMKAATVAAILRRLDQFCDAMPERQSVSGRELVADIRRILEQGNE